jgi:hypothetical protein
MCEPSRPFVFVWKDAVKRDQKLSSKAKLVLVMLMDYADLQGGSCFPSISRLMEDSSLSRNSVKRGLREAQKRGFISIQERRRGKESTSNLYELKLPNDPRSTQALPRSTQALPPRSTQALPRSTQGRDLHQDQNQKETPIPASRASMCLREDKPTREAQELLALWGQLLGGHKLKPDVLAGSTYEQMSTAMALTLWRHRTSRGTPERLRSIPGYFTTVLASCRRGEKQLVAYSRQDMWAIATQDVTPGSFLAR